MTIEQAKQELIKRYRYLYENAYLILAPYMYEQSQEDFEEFRKKYACEKRMIYLNITYIDNINSLLEEFLLSEKPMEESILYKFIESNRNNKEYLEKVQNGLALVKKYNEDKDYEMLKIKLDIFKILVTVYDYIKEQSGDLENKENKLRIIDEYCRIARYRNNGKIYFSGRNLSIKDCNSISVPLHKPVPYRLENDIGIRENEFIKSITKAPYHEENWSIFTEKEKQEIYLDYHDELPCDLEITCDINKNDCYDTRFKRPEETSPCFEKFYIKEEEIFNLDTPWYYRHYQLCPHCGYIVVIPEEILSEGIRKRIEDRCSNDDKLFKKMYLYSELFSLDKKSKEGQKKLLKK